VSTAKSSSWAVGMVPCKCLAESPTPRMKLNGMPRLLPVIPQDAAAIAKGGAATACFSQCEGSRLCSGHHSCSKHPGCRAGRHRRLRRGPLRLCCCPGRLCRGPPRRPPECHPKHCRCLGAHCRCHPRPGYQCRLCPTTTAAHGESDLSPRLLEGVALTYGQDTASFVRTRTRDIAIPTDRSSTASSRRHSSGCVYTEGAALAVPSVAATRLASPAPPVPPLSLPPPRLSWPSPRTYVCARLRRGHCARGGEGWGTGRKLALRSPAPQPPEIWS
jgi:hypothetical protein